MLGRAKLYPGPGRPSQQHQYQTSTRVLTSAHASASASTPPLTHENGMHRDDDAAGVAIPGPMTSYGR